MAIIKTCELTGKALDWAVAICETGCKPEFFNGSVWIVTGGFFTRIRRTIFEPSTNWKQGGPIIEREKISIDSDRDEWNAAKDGCGWFISGPTPLIAAMRCYVASELGDKVDIPEELLQ